MVNWERILFRGGMREGLSQIGEGLEGDQRGPAVVLAIEDADEALRLRFVDFQDSDGSPLWDQEYSLSGNQQGQADIIVSGIESGPFCSGRLVDGHQREVRFAIRSNLCHAANVGGHCVSWPLPRTQWSWWRG